MLSQAKSGAYGAIFISKQVFLCSLGLLMIYIYIYIYIYIFFFCIVCSRIPHK